MRLIVCMAGLSGSVRRDAEGSPDDGSSLADLYLSILGKSSSGSPSSNT